MKLALEFWLPGPLVTWRERLSHGHGSRHAEMKTHTKQAPLPKNGDRVYNQGPRVPPKIGPSKRTAALRVALVEALAVYAPDSPLEGPLLVDVVYQFEIPTGWPAWRQEAARAGFVPCVEHSRGDLCNLGKPFYDAMQPLYDAMKVKHGAGLIADDCLITKRGEEKRYGPVRGYQVEIYQLVAGPQSAVEWKAWKARERVDLPGLLGVGSPNEGGRA